MDVKKHPGPLRPHSAQTGVHLGQIKEVCDDGLKYGCASVCIPASFVKQAADYVGNELKICTVIGFPNGYSTTAVKVLRPRTPSATAPTRSTW